MSSFYVTLKKIIDNANLEILYTPCDPENIKITTLDINRPGLLIAGFDDFFDATRIQVLGMAEMGFIEEKEPAKRDEIIHRLVKTKPPAIIIARSIEPFAEIVEYGKQYKVPILISSENTSSLMSIIISLLSVELAPRITRHGVLVEVYGEGILIMGESGVGKSETAIELVKRGHRLIADDAVELRRVSNRTIVGNAPENIRHFVELRGVGIINVARIFGFGAVKISEKIDLVVELEQWNPEKAYSRTGLEANTIDILGIDLPTSLIPIRPGRNLAVIIETAAINNRQKKMGYNAARELLAGLGLAED